MSQVQPLVTHVRRKRAQMRQRTESAYLLGRIGAGALLLFYMMIVSRTLFAQDGRTITVRMVDSKTGQPIATSEIEVRIRVPVTSSQTKGIPPVYVRPNKDGVGTATFPIAASDIRVYASYGKANWSYVNCDSVQDRGSTQEHWYSISEILTTGIAPPNFCSKRKIAVKPGEFVFFVRPMTFREKMHE
jgi:hypothetical protein